LPSDIWGRILRTTCIYKSTRAVCKVRGLTLLLRVGTMWRCGDGLFLRSISLGKRYTSYNVPPTSQKRAADRWSLQNFLPRSSLFMAGKTQKSHGARSELNSVFGLKKLDRWNPIRTSAIQSRSRPMRFLGFSNHENGAPRQEISKWSTVCSTSSRSGWTVVRSASLAKGDTSKKIPSPHLHEVPIRSNKVSPRTFQTALVNCTGLKRLADTFHTCCLIMMLKNGRNPVSFYGLSCQSMCPSATSYILLFSHGIDMMDITLKFFVNLCMNNMPL
jgi:hypothetical protein